MLIKKADDKSEDLRILNRLLELPLTERQRILVEREIRCITSGARAEKDSAYFLEFEFRDSKNWAIIHDLRLEHDGFAAQIDHLLINRFLEIYVLESKNYFYGIKITPEGEFLLWNGKAFAGIQSPLEQNRRHIQVLAKVIRQSGMTPTRLGLPIPIKFHNYVLVAPGSRVDRPPKAKFDSSAVVKADDFVTAVRKQYDSADAATVIASLAKTVSTETLESFARALAFKHRRGGFDYPAKFGITVPTALPAASPSPRPSTAKEEKRAGSGGTCTRCGGGGRRESGLLLPAQEGPVRRPGALPDLSAGCLKTWPAAGSPERRERGGGWLPRRGAHPCMRMPLTSAQ